jgi:hypothetical protein
MRRWVIPTIGHRRLEQLTPADDRAVTAAIIGAGRSLSTPQRAQVVLTNMLRDALLEGYSAPQRVPLVPTPGDYVIEFYDQLNNLTEAVRVDLPSRIESRHWAGAAYVAEPARLIAWLNAHGFEPS